MTSCTTRKYQYARKSIGDLTLLLYRCTAVLLCAAACWVSTLASVLVMDEAEWHHFGGDLVEEAVWGLCGCGDFGGGGEGLEDAGDRRGDQRVGDEGGDSLVGAFHSRLPQVHSEPVWSTQSLWRWCHRRMRRWNQKWSLP